MGRRLADFVVFCLPTAACLFRISTKRAIRIFVRNDDGPVITVPVGFGQIVHSRHQFGCIQYVIGIGSRRYRLHLQQWKVGPQRNRAVRARETQIGEQRAKPRVGLDNPLIEYKTAG